MSSSGENPPRRGGPRLLSGGPVKFGPYWLDARLAVGGTAEVYVARPIDANLQPRKLIVKRLLPHFASDPQGRTMFEREAALHASVRHENVVRVYASGMAGDEPWLAMELVDGCDLYRLLRRLAGEGRRLSLAVACFVARQVLSALGSVHDARDAKGQAMYIVHRDVTPSNIYLSNDGRVKLGDFGIARAHRATMRPGDGDALKGKLAYLAPEQVAGDPFDYRADLFSIASVLAEMLIGKPLFAGSGQLAVLLAIRDCRLDALREERGSIPSPLYDTLERALARDPAARFPAAADFARALAPFDPKEASARAELGALVRWVQSAPSAEQIQAVRDSAGRIRAAVAARKAEAAEDTAVYVPIPSEVATQTGLHLGPWTFARLVEAIATGEIGRGDQVAYMGRPMTAIESIEELSRFLPARDVTTERVTQVEAPALAGDVSVEALVAVLLRVVETEATGVLFAEGPSEPRRADSVKGGSPDAGRKELYFVKGRLHHVASNNASELLGEYLVRRGMISREELDFALAVLPRYGGRMGDTLISLDLVASLQIFQAIRDQGRDRIVHLFQWRTGKLAFFDGQIAPHVEFPLDLELLPLIVAGVEAALPEDFSIARWRNRYDDVLVPAARQRARLRTAPWPALVRGVLDRVDQPRTLRDVLTSMAQTGATTATEVLRAVETLLMAGLLVWR